MFYKLQSEEQKRKYKDMLKMIGDLSLLFSDNKAPYLPYRCHENIFCKYFEAENLARKDCSVDAKKDCIGIGLKTWCSNDDNKIAEFGKLKNKYDKLEGLELVKKISEYRNERIRVTKNLYGLNEIEYHIVKRVEGTMLIYEHSFDYIDIGNIILLPERGNENNTYFSDGNHIYHFSTSKNTLYMLFEELVLLDTIKVDIIEDPFEYLSTIKSANIIEKNEFKFDYEKQICLRLYSMDKNGNKIVNKKSGLNQWNASGRKRDLNEIYIPYPSVDRKRNISFFPSQKQTFNLFLPDGTKILAKVCQENGKAIMSNPNKALGEWLLRKVLEIPEKELLTYEMLEKYNIDSVIFTKKSENEYFIDFSELGTYEKVYKKE